MSSLTKYDLQILEWQQFEILSFKCLQLDISPSIDFIDGGSDKGRDFLYKGVTNFFDSDNKKREYIFQAKHKSSEKSFSSLKSDFVKELEKVYIKNQYKYDTYCLVTNLTISGNQYDELTGIFNDFISKEEFSFDINFNIYSYRHFESCIDKHTFLKWDFPSIVKNTDFKLLLEDLFNRNERNITQGWLSVFYKNKDKFIYTGIFEESIQKLNENHVLLLSGPPKSGKTFNAEMIVLNSYCKNAFTPYKIDRIEDFDNFYDPNRNQIFLFDDVFGKHNIDLYRADSFDRKLEFIFELINDNHKCIFTSREYIYKAFLEYSESDVKKFITKITVEVSRLTNGEKESVFLRYHKINSENESTISDSVLESIVRHKNFSPETIRAYFENCDTFVLDDFLNHLKLPDKYLEKVFNNLSEEKRIILLSVLFSLKEDQSTISYSFGNICKDLKKELLISLKKELLLMDGSIIKNDNDYYNFYHPSMFDFFINYLVEDIATYRNILIRNFNINLLSIICFKIENTSGNNVIINEHDITNLLLGFNRILNNPGISIVELNSIFAWLDGPDIQLNFKLKLNSHYIAFKERLYELLAALNYSRYVNEDIYHISAFFNYISFSHQKIKINSSVFDSLIQSRKDDESYWLLIFRMIPLLEKDYIFNKIGRSWFQSFFSEIRIEIDALGNELYGDAYPDFIEVKKYRILVEDKKFAEADALKKKRRSDYMQKTNRNWYPRYKKCKEKISVLKASQPYGYKLYEKLIPKFEHLRRLEENQMNRYIFNKEKKWW